MSINKDNLGKVVVFLVSTDPALIGKYSSKKYDNFEFVISETLPELQQNPETKSEIPKIIDNSLIFTKNDDKNGFIYLTHREKPEVKFDWVEVSQSFANNYYNLESDDNYWRWGQVVPENGSYLCRDCGFIGDFLTGEVFPICDICLDGEPDGPIPLSEGYWEIV